MSSQLRAGAAFADISPTDSQFLFGYPHVKRYSTGIHDPLLSSALYLTDGDTQILFIANDIIFVPIDMARRVRRRIESATGVPAAHILTSATHTHSGPITVDYLSNQADAAVPKADPAYLEHMEAGLVQAACDAVRAACDAELGFAVADATGVGTNRRDPAGPADLDVPVLLVRERSGEKVMAAMLAAAACGWFTSPREAGRTWIRERDVFTPGRMTTPSNEVTS